MSRPKGSMNSRFRQDDSVPEGITLGPNGNIWFTESLGDKLGMINPTSLAITEHPLPTAGAEPDGIATGPGGNLWFTEYAGDQIGRSRPGPGGAFSEFTIPSVRHDGAHRDRGVGTGWRHLVYSRAGRTRLGGSNLAEADDHRTHAAVGWFRSPGNRGRAGWQRLVHGAGFREDRRRRAGYPRRGDGGSPTELNPGNGFGLTVAVEYA